MSDRDKKLLIYLGALLILAAAYFLVGKPFLDKIDALSSEKNQLRSELSAKRDAFENKAVYTQGIEESAATIQKIMDEFPEDNTDEKSIMFLAHAEADVPVWFPSVKFAEETKNMITNAEGEEGETQSASDVEAAAEQEAVAAAEGETAEGSGAGRGDETAAGDTGETGGNAGVSDLIYRDTEIGLTFETTYDGFKNLLAYIRDYEDRIVIKDIDVAYNEKTGLATGTVVLSQYALLGPGRVLPDVETDVEDFGTENVFTNNNHGGSILDLIAEMYTDFLEKILGEVPQEALDEIQTDYFVKVNAVTDNTNGKTAGRADDSTESTYITSSSNSNEDVNFRVSGEDGDYSVTYKIGDAEYTDNIKKSGDTKIYLRIVSTSRMSDDDESAVTVHAINNSDIPLVINIEGDDAERPRVSVTEKVGEVTVNGER
ncbi:MAG: hypothetical protein K6E49_06975 [Lachnospiraceae bacterium]|nr:hypothetical protein [Lachnospiraceae bacterium]